MSFYSSAAAHAMYRSNRFDDALAVAERILADNPHESEAHMTVALVCFRRNDVAGTIESLKKCLPSRSAEWLLERLRQDLQAHGRPPLQRDMAFKLGAFFRSNLNNLGPALAPEHRRAGPAFINVVGTSYVRSFGASPAFLPVFIGMGPTMLLMTEAQASVTQRKFRENLKRIDPRRSTMLVVGGDPYYRVVALRTDKVDRSQGATDEDFALMDVVAERHRQILNDAQAVVTGPLMFLAATPTFDDLTNELCVYLNARLKALCEAQGVVFLDWWDKLIDPATGHLRADFSANAYPGDIHFSLSTTKFIMELMQQDGLLPDGVEPSSAFAWSHVFECEIDPSEKTRFWCEPGVTPRNAFQSHKIASTHLNFRVGDILTCLGVQYPEQTILMANVRDGFLPSVVPSQVHAGCLAFTDTADNLQIGRAVMDFYGRLDVRLESPDRFDLVDGRTFSQLVLLIHPATAEADEQRARALIGRLESAPSIVIGTPFPERIDRLGLGERPKNLTAVSNRHVPEEWRNYTVAVVR